MTVVKLAVDNKPIICNGREFPSRKHADFYLLGICDVINGCPQAEQHHKNYLNRTNLQLLLAETEIKPKEKDPAKKN